MPAATAIRSIRSPGSGPNGPGPIDSRAPLQIASPWQPANPATLTTIRYVRKTGSDANGGTSPADAWLTITKALQTASPGTVIYVGAGTYRETVQVTITPTASLPVAVVGDVDGSFTGDAGMVQLTAYTTNDKTAPSATSLLDLNGKSNLTFQGIMCVGGNALLVTATTPSQQIAFRDCSFHAGRTLLLGLMSVTSAFGVPLNWMIDRCEFFCGAANGSILVTCTTGVGADYDVNFIIRNAFAISGDLPFIRVVAGGAVAGHGNGVHIWNSTVIGPIINAAANISTQFPSTIYNTYCYNPTTTSTIAVNTLGAVVEDYNLLLSGGTPRTNTNVGAHSISDGSYAPLLHFGQERIWGGNLRPFGEPMASSPLNAFGADGSQTPYDGRNGPRPTGILRPAVGAFERGNNFVKETGTVHTGTNAISVVGDGFYDFYLPVDAGAKTVSIFCQRDSNYSGPPPRLQIVPNQEIGVGDPSAWGTPAGVGAFEQLSVPVNPTASGVLIVRVISSDISGIAKTIFDTIAYG